jgi:hypothetical protein
MASSRPSLASDAPGKPPEEESNAGRAGAMPSKEPTSSDVEIQNLDKYDLDGGGTTEHDDDDDEEAEEAGADDYPDEQDMEEGMDGEEANEADDEDGEEEDEEDDDDPAAAARYANEVLRLLMGRLQRPPQPPVCTFMHMTLDRAC